MGDNFQTGDAANAVLERLTELRKAALNDSAPMQWRGSDDGIIWTAWRGLTSPRTLLPFHEYYQARILIDGEWRIFSRSTTHLCASNVRVSKVETDGWRP